MSNKERSCKDLTHHLPLTRTVVTDEELKNLFNCDRELTTKDYELLINSKVHVDDIYEKKEIDEILNSQQGQLNNHEQRIENLETNRANSETATNHTHTNKDILDMITYSGAKSEIDLHDIEDFQSQFNIHFNDEESHTTKTEKDNWNITSEKVVGMETEVSILKGEISLKATKTELEKIEAKLNGITLGSGNLLRNSNFKSNLNFWEVSESNEGTVSTLSKNGKRYCHINQIAGVSSIGQLVESFEQGVKYTISFTGYGSGELYLEIHQRGDGDNYPLITNIFTLTETETKQFFTFDSDTDVLENSFYVKLGTRSGFNSDIKFTEIKFERNDSVSEWTPHSADILLDVDELEQNLIDLSKYINSAFKDGIITQAECKALEERIESLEREKVDVKAQVDIFLKNPILNNTTEREQLLNAYNGFTLAHKQLIDGIRKVIEDKKITTSEKNEVTSLTTLYSEKLVSIRIAIQNVTSKISEFHAESAYEKAEQLILKEVSDVDKSLTNIKNLTDNIFLDGLISLTESQSLKLMFEDLEKEKTELIAQVDEIQLRDELSGTQELLKLGKAEEEFISAHTDLLSCISNICADNKVTGVEKRTFEIKFDIYKQKLIALKGAMQKALDKIAAVKMEQSLQDAKDYADNQVLELNKEINDLQNLTNEAFKDGVLTVAEKQSLKLELKNIEKEQADVLAQVGVLTNPHLSPELISTSELRTLEISKDDFVNKYRGLNSTIGELLNKTLIGDIDRKNLNYATGVYVNALKELRENIQVAINKIAEVKAVKEADKIKDRIVYKLEIFSTNGGVFKNGTITTTLQARVYFGKDEITYNFLPTNFKWTRISNNSFADERWNLSAPKNYEIDITEKDVIGGRTTFNCELLDEQGNKIVSAF